MTKEQELYLSIGKSLENSVESQMFGKPCFKVNGKAFISLFGDEMVFKLTGPSHQEALSLDGSKLFDPSGKKRPMKEWVQVPFDYADKWEELAKESIRYVSSKTA